MADEQQHSANDLYRDKLEEVSGSDSRRKDLAQQKMKELLEKYPDMAYEFGKGSNKFLLCKGSERTSGRVKNPPEGAQGAITETESRLLLTEVGFRVWEFTLYPKLTAYSYELSSQRLNKILKEVEENPALISSMLGYHTENGDEKLIIDGGTLGASTEIDLKPESQRAYSRISIPDGEKVKRLLDAAKNEIGLTEAQPPDRDLINRDLEMLNSVII